MYSILLCVLCRWFFLLCRFQYTVYAGYWYAALFSLLKVERMHIIFYLTDWFFFLGQVDIPVDFMQSCIQYVLSQYVCGYWFIYFTYTWLISLIKCLMLKKMRWNIHWRDILIIVIFAKPLAVKIIIFHWNILYKSYISVLYLFHVCFFRIYYIY